MAPCCIRSSWTAGGPDAIPSSTQSPFEFSKRRNLCARRLPARCRSNHIRLLNFRIRSPCRGIHHPSYAAGIFLNKFAQFLFVVVGH